MLIYFWPYLQFCLSVKIISLLVFIYSAFWFWSYKPASLKVIELRYPFPFPVNLVLLVQASHRYLLCKSQISTMQAHFHFLYRPALNKTPLWNCNKKEFTILKKVFFQLLNQGLDQGPFKFWKMFLQHGYAKSWIF